MSKEKILQYSSKEYLESILAKKDKDLGIGGNCCFNVYVLKKLVFKIENLTKVKAKELFDIFDEHNQMSKLIAIQIEFQITENGKELDFNVLPNVFTEFF